MRIKFPGTQTIRSIKKETLHLWTAFAFYAVVFLIFFSPVLFGAKLFPSDGQLPAFYAPLALWDNLLWSGFPLAADGTWQAWYPLRHLFRLLPIGWDFNGYVLSVYVLSSSFTYGYVYALTRSWLAGAAAGIVFGMSGFMIGHIGTTSLIHTAMWHPLIMWSMERLRRSFSAPWVGIGAGAVGNCVLAGHFQVALYSLVFSFLYALVSGKNAATSWARYMASVCLVFLLGVGLSAILVLPAMEFSGLSARDAMSFDGFASPALPINQLFQIFFPYLLGGGAPPIYGTIYFGAPSIGELSGYAGLLPWILASITLFSREKRRLCIFFFAVILFSIIISLGNATPLAKILYQVPYLNKFRVPARHLFEMNFAVSVLTGMGIYLIHSKKVQLGQIISGSALFFLIIGIALICIQIWYPEYGKSAGIRNVVLPKMFSNHAIVIPLVILLLSNGILFFWRRSLSSLRRRGFILITILLNMWSFAWFFEWEDMAFPLAYLGERPYAEKLKMELAQNRQRMAPIDEYASALLPPNMSKYYEIPSANGYGPLVLKRYQELSGIQEPGTLRDGSFLTRDNHSFDILAIRYVLSTRPGRTPEASSSPWSKNNLAMMLGSACNVTFPNRWRIEIPSAFPADRLGVVSMMGCSTDIKQGAAVLRLAFTEENGRKSHTFLRAGIETSEWAHECEHVKPSVRHELANIFTTFVAGGCKGHDYWASIPLAGGNFSAIDLEWTGMPGFITIHKISLFSEDTNQHFLLEKNDAFFSDRDKWKLVEKIGETEIYENLHAMPRAWLASEVISAPANGILKAIHTSVLPDGRRYRPEKTALVEEPLSVRIEGEDSPSSAEVVQLSNMSIQVRTKSRHPRFLVVSDVYYPGWVAAIDGMPTRIFRTNYALRGVMIPEGEHMVSFQFRPRSLFLGAILSGLSTFLIIIAGIVVYYRHRNELGNRAKEASDGR
jgi:hypothetical protein